MRYLRQPRLSSPTLALGLLGLLATPAPALAQGDASPPTLESPGDPFVAQDLERSKTTLHQMRDIGLAMMAWLTDEMAEDSCPDSEAGAPDEEQELRKADWSRCSSISHAELAEILVPTYLETLPTEDPWGGEYDYCLAVVSPCKPSYALGVRSSGRDHRWDGDIYATGPFPPEEADHDIVWADGYFLVWPEATQTDVVSADEPPPEQ